MAEPNLAGVSRAEARAIQRLAWPDVWAIDSKLAVDGHPFDLRGREYERQILRDESPTIEIPKGAQLGLTTVFLMKSCHAVIEYGWHVLYLLPVKAGSVQFVQGRIDPMIDSNPVLKAEFSRTDNRVQKQTRKGINWYIRGTNIETELREVPSDILVLDERDKAHEDNLDHARERISGSKIGRTYELSTPTIDGHGVYAEDGFPSTDQMRWWVPCPHCGTKQVLSFQENVEPWLGDVIEDCAFMCSHCKRMLSDDDRGAMNAGGTWVPDNPGASTRGYHLSQLNSPTKKLADPKNGILVNFFKGKRDSKKLKSFYNLGLGLPFAAPGDKFTVELLNKCRGDFLCGGLPEGPLFIGIDQGMEELLVTVYTQSRGRKRLWNIYQITAESDRTKWQVLNDLLQSLSNWIAVCDAHPDKEDAEELSIRYSGRFWMGFEKDRPDQPETAAFGKAKWGEPAKVNIDRTMAFDSYIKQFLDGNIWFPRDAEELGEYLPRLGYNGFYQQHLAMARVEQPDANDRMVARWITSRGTEGKKADHWHHSGMFALVASMQDIPFEYTEVGDLFAAAGGVVG